jgi:putative hydrolase of the HAD superfamily
MKNFQKQKKALKALKGNGLNLVLVTNSPPTSKKAFQDLDLSKYFDKTVFSCDIGVLKPSKEIFTHAISKFNVESSEALMVGDSLEKDVKGAINSGLEGLLIDRKGLVQYDNKISNLMEILDKTKK